MEANIEHRSSKIELKQAVRGDARPTVRRSKIAKNFTVSLPSFIFRTEIALQKSFRKLDKVKFQGFFAVFETERIFCKTLPVLPARGVLPGRGNRSKDYP